MLNETLYFVLANNKTFTIMKTEVVSFIFYHV